MLEIITLLGGALTRLLPSLLGFFKEGRDLKYELLRMDKEIALEQMRGEQRQQEIAAMNAFTVDTAWANGLVRALEQQTQVTGDKWLDRMNVGVRPIITYWWCLVLYTVYKLIFIVAGFQEGLPLREFGALVVDPFDRAVIGSIIGFWFVDRALRKYTGR